MSVTPEEFLERIVPYTGIHKDEFSPEFSAWLAVLVDNINSTIEQIEEKLASP